jgi:L-lactate dehydrogenase complex protein LldF
MGSVLTPSYVGLEKTLDLPQAATMCGECNRVCPVGIPISDLLRKLRERQVDRGLRPWQERAALAAWAFAARRPRLYSALSALGSRALKWMGRERGSISKLSFGGGWTDTREMPVPSGKTFRAMYRERRAPR